MGPLLSDPTSHLSLNREDRFSPLPLWVWILLAFGFAVVVAIIITLKEEQQTTPRPASAPFPPSPPEPEKMTAEVADSPPAEPLAVEARPDNLKRVKGIGPKIEKLLNNNGITTFAKLAETQADWLQNLLVEAGWENIADPTTWPEQAGQLVQGKSSQG